VILKGKLGIKENFRGAEECIWDVGRSHRRIYTI